MRGEASFSELSASLLEVIILETPRINKWAGWATEVRKQGEVPALDVEGLRDRLGHLGEAQRLFAALAPHEGAVREFLASLNRKIA
jgi:hypothetical protein